MARRLAGITGRLGRLGRRVRERARLRRRAVLVSDDAGWVIDSVAGSLAGALPPDVRATVVADSWREARDSAIHFISRQWAWQDGLLDGAAPSNRLIGLWWHGLPDAVEPDAREALARVRRVHDRFALMHVTCGIAERTLLELGVPAERIRVIPMGLDLGRFRPPAGAADRRAVRRRLGLPEDALVVGSFQKDGQGWGDGNEPKLVKGPDVLADALALLHARLPVVVLIPGPARGYLESRLRADGVPYVRPGFVPDEEFAQLHHALDLYVSPSRDEGGPAGVLEAMASGVPVVSTRSGMPADMLTGDNGVLVDVEDPAALAAAAERLLADAALRDRVAEAALGTIAAYDWPVVAERYARELYRPLLTGS